MSKTVLYLDETLKMLRETCCVAQTALDYSAAGGSRGEEHIERLQRSEERRVGKQCIYRW